MNLSTFFTPDLTLYAIPFLLAIHVAAFTWYHIKAKDFKWKEFPNFLKVGSLFMAIALMFNVLYTLIKGSEYGQLAVDIMNGLRLVVIIGAIAYYVPQIIKHARGVGLPAEAVDGVEEVIDKLKDVPKEIVDEVKEAVDKTATDPETEQPQETTDGIEATQEESTNNGDLQ